jgi:Trk K+ transport system NAD-binding subunit
VAASGRKLEGDATHLIAIIRGEHLIVPRPETTLEAGDKLILVANSESADGV